MAQQALATNHETLLLSDRPRAQNSLGMAAPVLVLVHSVFMLFWWLALRRKWS